LTPTAACPTGGCGPTLATASQTASASTRRTRSGTRMSQTSVACASARWRGARDDRARPRLLRLRTRRRRPHHAVHDGQRVERPRAMFDEPRTGQLLTAPAPAPAGRRDWSAGAPALAHANGTTAFRIAKEKPGARRRWSSFASTNVAARFAARRRGEAGGADLLSARSRSLAQAGEAPRRGAKGGVREVARIASYRPPSRALGHRPRDARAV
jgi:hypothetical protein